MGKGAPHLPDTAGAFWKLKWIMAGLIGNIWPYTASICSFLHDLAVVCVCGTELPDVHQSEVTFGYLCAWPWHGRVSTLQSLAFVTGNQ